MASTYSVTLAVSNGNVGYPAHNGQLPTNHQIEDAYAAPAAKQRAMSSMTQVQVKRPDGSLKFYTIDASRSDPSKGLVYLLAV